MVEEVFLTSIRRVVKKQYYLKTALGDKRSYKRTYDRAVYVLQFPSRFDVSDMVGRPLRFSRRGDMIKIEPV